jgi:hypothetical protein
LIHQFGTNLKREMEAMKSLMVQFKFKVGDTVLYRTLDGWECATVLQKRVHYGLPAYCLDLTSKIVYESDLRTINRD